MAKHYLNEAGTDILLDTGILIGTVDDQLIKFKKPGGTTGSWDAVLHDTYSTLAKSTGTYYVKYTLAESDLDEAGEWKLQAWVAAADGTWHGETVSLDVLNLYE